jgi:hypothetical protein
MERINVHTKTKIERKSMTVALKKEHDLKVLNSHHGTIAYQYLCMIARLDSNDLGLPKRRGFIQVLPQPSSP